ncbi:MAG: hypothetical protein KIT60_12040 [Burkholderiaceae bacterium]|nr:hypothetical protein [Burkholderiaceae bacterium]
MELLFYVFGPIAVLGAIAVAMVPFIVAGAALATGRPIAAALVTASAAGFLAIMVPVEVEQSGKSVFWPWPLAIAVFLGRVSYSNWAQVYQWLLVGGAAALVLGFVGAFIATRVFGVGRSSANKSSLRQR